MDRFDENNPYKTEFPGDEVEKYWCPFCNHIIYLKYKFCDCGWKINKDGAMAKKCPKHLWEKHKPFIDEYRYMKENGLVKNGCEYFKSKVGNTEMGKLVVKKVEHRYTKEEEEKKRILGISENYFPDEWK